MDMLVTEALTKLRAELNSLIPNLKNTIMEIEEETKQKVRALPSASNPQHPARVQQDKLIKEAANRSSALTVIAVNRQTVLMAAISVLDEVVTKA